MAGGEPRRLISTSSWRVSNHWNACLVFVFFFSGDDDADVVVVADVVVAVASAEVIENAVFVVESVRFRKGVRFRDGADAAGLGRSLGADDAPGEDLDRA